MSLPRCIQSLLLRVNTRATPTEPVELKSGEPTTNICPSLVMAADFPNRSKAASPSISCPTCRHWGCSAVVSVEGEAVGDGDGSKKARTLTWPLLSPFASLFIAPTATLSPSLDSDTAQPNKSLFKPLIVCPSPSIQAPFCSHAPPIHCNTCTWPLPTLILSLYGAPTATVSPSLLNDTAPPSWSSAASPSMSDPFCTQPDTDHS